MMSTTLRLSETEATVNLRAAGAGEPLILIHGVGLQLAAWEPQVEALKADYNVIAVDMPGHGGSSALPGTNRLPDFVAWAADLIKSLGLGPVNLAGHSMGALIAGGVAVEAPALITRVALLNGVYCRDPDAQAAVIARAEAIRAGNVDLQAPLARWFPDATKDQTARAHVAKWLNDVGQNGYAAAYTAFAHGDADYADRLHQISCPFAAITADGDPNSTPAMSFAMAKTVKDGEAVTIKGHRHMVNLTAASDVTTHLRNWLKRQPLTQKEAQ